MDYGGAAPARTRVQDDHLWVVLGILEVLAGRADLSSDARALAEAALVAAEEAAEKMRAVEQMLVTDRRRGHRPAAYLAPPPVAAAITVVR